MPVAVPDGYFAVAFFYDPETGDFEGIPTFPKDENSLTFVTTHFSDVVFLGAPLTFLDGLKIPPEYTPGSDFTPGIDTWNLTNAGAYLAAPGYCRGLNITALYYYLYEKPTANEGLWKGEYDNGLEPQMKTPDLEVDDKWAIQLCSVAQAELSPDGLFDRMVEFYRWSKEEWSNTELTSHQRDFYQIAFSLWVDQEPQFLAVYGTRGGELAAHSLICYGIFENTLYVSDPNYPADSTLKIVWDWSKGEFMPYQSPGGTVYNWVAYDGAAYHFDTVRLESLWAEYEAQGTGHYFPSYDILVTEYDAEGNEGTSYAVDRTGGFSTNATFLKFSLFAPFDGQLTVYRFEDRQNPISSADAVELRPGDNYLGLHVEGKKEGKEGWWWAGFDWVNIKYDAREEPAVVPPQADFSFSLKAEWRTGTATTAEGWYLVIDKNPNFPVGGAVLWEYWYPDLPDRPTSTNATVTPNHLEEYIGVANYHFSPGVITVRLYAWSDGVKGKLLAEQKVTITDNPK